MLDDWMFLRQHYLFVATVLAVACLAGALPHHKASAPSFQIDDSPSDYYAFIDVLNRGGRGPWRGWPASSERLTRQLNAWTHEIVRQRAKELQAVTNSSQALLRQHSVRERFREAFVGDAWPLNSTLSANVTEVLESPDGYAVEKILFESRPGFFVTAALWRPNPAPSSPTAGIVFCSGHAPDAFRNSHPTTYQFLLANLAVQGFVVLAFDPVGQGERLQYVDTSGSSEIGGPTSEHQYFGVQWFASGRRPAEILMWDVRQALTYLQSRTELVDRDRIGVCGQSGGGTQSSYAAALLFDDFAVAMPSSYITEAASLMDLEGPQDAEQVWPNLWDIRTSPLIDFSDLALAFAPKPFLALGTTRDFFPIGGFYESVREAERFYAVLNATDSFRWSVDDSPHNYTDRNRYELYRFAHEHLRVDGSPFERPSLFQYSDAELTVTSTGQVVTAVDSRTVFDVLQESVAPTLESLQRRRSAPDIDAYIRAVRERASALRFTGSPFPGEETSATFLGRLRRSNFTVERFVLSSGDAAASTCLLPLLVYYTADSPPPFPAPSSQNVTVLLRDDGMTQNASASLSDGLVMSLLARGRTVVTVDLCGIGQSGDIDIQTSAPNYWDPLGPKGSNAQLDAAAQQTLWMGGSVPALHAAEMERVVAWACGYLGVAEVSLLVWENLVPAAALAVSSSGPRISQLAAVRPLITAASLVTTRLYRVPTWSVIPNLLSPFDPIDFADLWATFAPHRLLLLGPWSADRTLATADDAATAYAVTRRAFEAVETAFRVEVGEKWNDPAAVDAFLVAWLCE